MLDFVKNIGPTEIVIIVLILVILFGSKIVTMLARTAGESLREIKKVKSTFTEAVEDTDDKPNKKEDSSK